MSQDVMDRLSQGSSFFFRNLESGTEFAPKPLVSSGTYGSRIWYCDFPNGVTLKSLVGEIAFADASLEDELELIEIVLYTVKTLPSFFVPNANPAGRQYFRDWTSEDFRYAGVPNGYITLRFGNGWKDSNPLDVLVKDREFLIIQYGAVVKGDASISSLRVPVFVMFDVNRKKPRRP